MSALDQIDSIRTVDKGGMADILLEFPARVEMAIAHKLPDLRIGTEAITSIAVVGMGGSAIGGDLAAAAIAADCPVPIAIIRSASLPRWVTSTTLVIIVSYSGNTAEPSVAYAEARARGCPMAVITSGGSLANRAHADGVPVVQVGAYPGPRLAVGDLTIALLKIAAAATGVNPSSLSLLPQTLHTLSDALRPQTPTERNQAKLLAYKIFDGIPVVVGGGVLAPVATRWKGQINENAKSLCITDQFPEALHNTIEGMCAPVRVRDDSIWITLERPGDDILAPLFDRLAALLEEKEIRHERVTPPLHDLLLAQWWALYLGDWVSYYLAALNGVDPMPVPTIEKFKKGA